MNQATATFQLGEDGLRWVASSLSRGLSLARVVADRYDLSTGCVFADLPAGVTVENKKEFSRGGIAKLALTESVLELRIPALSLRQGARTLIVENDLMRPEDPVAKDAARGTFIFEQEVYHQLNLAKPRE